LRLAGYFFGEDLVSPVDHASRLSSTMRDTPVTLLQRLREGPAADPSAWQRFVEMFAPLVFQWARRFGLQDADAEETVQDVFLTLLRRLRTFDYNPNQSFRAWLSTVTRNQALARLRRSAASPLVEDIPGPESDSELERREYCAWIMQRATQIIARDFEPLTWSAFQGYVLENKPAADVARDLGMSRNAVYIARNRVLARLRDVLAGLLD
jgi:RNA polymerase sigma-70 factor (ECF subfamily)